MALLVPPPVFAAWQASHAVPSVLKTITANAAANTKGAYTELITTTNFDAYRVEVVFYNNSVSAADTGCLVDIAVGAAGSEAIIIPDLNAGFCIVGPGASNGGQKYVFPLFIPAGSRIAARCQAVIAGDVVDMSFKIYGKPSGLVWAGSRVIAYGVDAANSQGVVVAAGVSDAEGAWVQIAAASSVDHAFLSAGLSLNDNNKSAAWVMLDVGIGAAAAETAIGEGYLYGVGTAESILQGFPAEIWRPVPSGTRLAARCSHNSATAEDYDVILYGVVG